jgi:hypothetical protein
MPGNNIILGHRVGISNFRPSAMKNMDMYDSYWRENIAREGARHRAHQQNPGVDRLLNPHGWEQGLPDDRTTLGAKDAGSRMYGTFYADTMQHLADTYHGSAGKSRYRYGVGSMSKYHQWLTGSFSNPELATTYARGHPMPERRAPVYKFPTEQRKVDRHYDSAASTARSHKSDLQRKTTHCI